MVREERRIAFAAVLAVVATYYGAWSLGLWWDDYVALRPWRLTEVAAAFAGPWDRWDVWPVFYRPLAIAWYALSFELFGLNAAPMHVVSLIGLTVAAWLAGTFAWRETGSPIAGIGAAAIYGAHPAIAFAQGPWLFLQNHLLCTLVAAAALCSWQHRRSRPVLRHWWPLFALGLTGFLIQEDMIMLLPLLLALQAVRAWTVADVPLPPARLVAAIGVFVVGLVAARWFILGELGGQGVPSIPTLVVNVLRGPLRTWAALGAPREPISLVVTAAMLLTLGAGIRLIIRSPRTPIAALLGSGIAVSAAFASPLALASSWSRFHLVAFGAVLGAAAAIAALSHARPSPRPRMVAMWTALLVLLCGAATRPAIVRDACDPRMLWSDTQVLEWPQLPAHVRTWLANKPAACERGAPPAWPSSLDIAVWIQDARTQLPDHSSEQGGAGTHLVALVHQQAQAVAFEVRAAPGTGAIQIEVASNGNAATPFALDESWQPMSIAVSANWRTRLRAMHRIDVRAMGPGQFQTRGISLQR
jgi:hypothetical protein